MKKDYNFIDDLNRLAQKKQREKEKENPFLRLARELKERARKISDINNQSKWIKY